VKVIGEREAAEQVGRRLQDHEADARDIDPYFHAVPPAGTNSR